MTELYEEWKEYYEKTDTYETMKEAWKKVLK